MMKYFIPLVLFCNIISAQNTSELCQKLVGDGSGKDATARTAIMKMTHTSAIKNGNDRQLQEKALLVALQKSPSAEVSTFLIQQLEICGGKSSLPILAQLLNDVKIGQNAVRALIKLAPFDAKLSEGLLLTALNKSHDNSQAYLLNALSVLKAKSDKTQEAFRQNLSSKGHSQIASFQGLASIGAVKDQSSFLKAFSKASQVNRGRLFRLNLLYVRNLAQNNKSAANKHLSTLKSQLKPSEIPFITGIASIDFEINGISDKWLQSIPQLNPHTQVGILRLLKTSKVQGLDARIQKLCEQNPNQTIYLETLAAINPTIARPYVLKSLNSSNADVQVAANKLAVHYGSNFAEPLVKSLLQKKEISRNDISLAKSMISPNNISKIAQLWTRLTSQQTLAFIELTSKFSHSAIAAKMIQAAKSDDSKIKRAALKGLKEVVSAENFSTLRSMLEQEKSSSSARYLQVAIGASLIQADSQIIKELTSSLSQKRNDILLAAFVKSNRPEVLPLLKKDLITASAEIQKETLKSLSAMKPELSIPLLIIAIENSKDERNLILAVRGLAATISQSTEPASMKVKYIEKALKTKLGAPEKQLLQDNLKKLAPKKKKKKKSKGKPTESAATYSPLFSGDNLDQWDNKGDYKVVDGNISGTNGHLWSKKSYSNFSLKFEFKLAPGTNNGLAIRTPKGQKPIELQIIDNDHPKYKKIKDYQRHGSLYSYAPAKRGFLKKTGEWNSQEVICNGSMVTVILNGTTILEADLATVKPVEGSRYKVKYINDAKEGHIGFLGHRTPITLRAIEIKEL
jgi:hypothetical protein